jgi:hypothetical protein
MNTRKIYQAEEGMILDMPNTGLRFQILNDYVRKTEQGVDDLEETSFDTTAQSLILNAINNLPTAIQNGTIADTPGAVSDYDVLYLIQEIIEEKMEDFDGPEN